MAVASVLDTTSESVSAMLSQGMVEQGFKNGFCALVTVW